MLLAAVSLIANIYVVRLHEHRYTTRMSTFMRFLVFRLIARVVGVGDNEERNANRTEYVHHARKDEPPNKENVQNSNVERRQHMLPGTDIEPNDCYKEERRAAANIMDRLFLITFCIIFLMIAIYAFAIS